MKRFALNESFVLVTVTGRLNIVTERRWQNYLRREGWTSFLIYHKLGLPIMVMSRVSLKVSSNLSLTNNIVRFGWSIVSYSSVSGPERL